MKKLLVGFLLIFTLSGLPACGQETHVVERNEPQVVYDGANESVIVIQEDDDDDMYFYWYLLMLQQHSYSNNAYYNNYGSYRTQYIERYPAYRTAQSQSTRITYNTTNIQNIVSNPVAKSAVNPKATSGNTNPGKNAVPNSVVSVPPIPKQNNAQPKQPSGGSSSAPNNNPAPAPKQQPAPQQPKQPAAPAPAPKAPAAPAPAPKAPAPAPAAPRSK